MEEIQTQNTYSTEFFYDVFGRIVKNTDARPYPHLMQSDALIWKSKQFPLIQKWWHIEHRSDPVLNTEDFYLAVPMPDLALRNELKTSGWDDRCYYENWWSEPKTEDKPLDKLNEEVANALYDMTQSANEQLWRRKSGKRALLDMAYAIRSVVDQKNIASSNGMDYLLKTIDDLIVGISTARIG